MQTETKKYTCKYYQNLHEGSTYQLINRELIMSSTPNIYEKFGVKEYLIADLMDKSIKVYANEGNEFALFDKKQTKGDIRSKILSKLNMEVEEIFGKAYALFL